MSQGREASVIRLLDTHPNVPGRSLGRCHVFLGLREQSRHSAKLAGSGSFQQDLRLEPIMKGAEDSVSPFNSGEPRKSSGQVSDALLIGRPWAGPSWSP